MGAVALALRGVGMIALALFIELMVILAGAFVLGKVYDILDERDLRKRQDESNKKRS